MVTLLTYLVIGIGLLTAWRLMRVLELVRDLRGEEEHITQKDNLFNGRMFIAFMIIGFAGMIYFTIDAK